MMILQLRTEIKSITQKSNECSVWFVVPFSGTLLSTNNFPMKTRIDFKGIDVCLAER